MHNDDQTSCDVAILGGGIAGLLMASALAKRHKVIVIEKNSSVWPSKYWLTDEGSLASNPDLSSSVDCTYEHLDFIGHDESFYRCYGRYVLWDSEALVRTLTDRITSAEGLILTSHTFYSYRSAADRIDLMVNDKIIKAKLAIDCMGHHSPIIYAQGIIDVAGYYLLHGATLPANGHINPVALHNLVLNESPGYVEAFPTKDGRVHLILIKASRSLKPASSLREDFAFLINRSPYKSVIKQPGKGSFLGGIIPTGRLRRRALDRLYFFGEAGQANPAATATALTRMLYTYRAIAAHLSDCVTSGKLKERDLSTSPASTISAFDRRLHGKLFRDVLNWNSDKFTRIVKEMDQANDHDLVNCIMFGHLPPSIALASAKKLLSRGSTSIFRYVMNGFWGSS